MNKIKCELCVIGFYCRLVFELLSNINVVFMLRFIILLFILVIYCFIENDFLKEICFIIENMYKFRYFVFDFDNFLKE